jgi:hypothetical protein
VVRAVVVPRTNEVPFATPRVGVTKTGEVENTTFVDVVPVVPVAAAK